jgi:hypothetical protein
MFSELEDYIHRQLELALASSVVVCGTIESMVKSDFGTQQNGASHPMSPHQSLLSVAGLDAGSLTFHFVQEVGAN